MSKSRKSDSHVKASSANNLLAGQSKIIKNLSFRFSWNNIKNERNYLKYMNPKMQIDIQPFYKDKIFEGKNKQEIINLLKHVPCFKLLNKKGQKIGIFSYNQPAAKIKIQYENENKILLVTGINEEYLNHFLAEFRSQMVRFDSIKQTHKNQFWSAIQLNYSDGALMLKKFLRNKKITSDLDQNHQYRIPKRKIRIVLLQQDFFTVLLDLISQQANQKFLQNFNNVPYRSLLYSPLQFQGKQIKKTDAEQIIFYDDASEDYLSKSSDLYGRGRLGQLNQIQVQMKNQGIQFEGKQQQKDVYIQTDFNNQKIQEIQIDINQEKVIENRTQQKRQNHREVSIQLINKYQHSNNITTEKAEPIIVQQRQQFNDQITNRKKEIQKTSEKIKDQILNQKDPNDSSSQADSLEMQGNQIGCQVQQINKTIAESKKFQFPSPLYSGMNSRNYRSNNNLSEKKPKKKYVEAKKQQKLSESGRINSMKNFFINRQDSLQKSNQLEIKRPKQLTSLPLANKILDKPVSNENIPNEGNENNLNRRQMISNDLIENRQINRQENDKYVRKIQEESRELLQFSYAVMKRKQQEYLKKIGRKEIQIPEYIKKPSQRIIFKHKFYEQVIKNANQSKKSDKF